MTLDELSRFSAMNAEKSEGNRIQAEWALEPSLVGTRIFEESLLGTVSANDPLFMEYRRTGIIGPHSMLPTDWLEGAQSVLSIFLPFAKEVRASNHQKGDPSSAWMHGRYEGQMYVEELCTILAEYLRGAGEQAVVPAMDPRFRTVQDIEQNTYTSNWSERHAAYAAGLGTFSLSKGLITKRGTAGRIGSVVTTLHLPPTPRDYTGLYDYCTFCMACARRCEAEAIGKEGKQNPPCKRWLLHVEEFHPPRSGCGKCQTGVPCEDRRPLKTKT